MIAEIGYLISNVVYTTRLWTNEKGQKDKQWYT